MRTARGEGAATPSSEIYRLVGKRYGWEIGGSDFARLVGRVRRGDGSEISPEFLGGDSRRRFARRLDRRSDLLAAAQRGCEGGKEEDLTRKSKTTPFPH